MKKRILVYSWFFPPVNSSEGIVTYKLLNNSEYEYDVFTQSANKSWSYKKSEELKLNSNIHYIDSGTKLFDDFLKAGIEYYKNNSDKYDIVMTRVMAEVSHMIGLEIKKINPKITWIASFGDPIAYNPYHIKSMGYKNPYSLSQRYVRHMSIKEMLSLKRFLKSMLYKVRYKRSYKKNTKPNIILQEETLNNADYIIYNSSYQRDYMLSFYSNKEELDKKTLILPHSFDEKLFDKNIEKKNTNKINFSFVGHLDDIRTPHPLFAALNRLKEYDPDLCEKAEFNFYGNVSNEEKIYLIDNDLFDVVRLKKPVDYIESLRVMQRADWLVHIDANIADIVDKNLFFAAKIADYMGTKNKILGITMIDGISADILRNYNALVTEICAEEVFVYLYKIIYEGYTKEPNIKSIEKYNSKNVAKEFDKVIKSIRKDH